MLIARMVRLARARLLVGVPARAVSTETDLADRKKGFINLKVSDQTLAERARALAVEPMAGASAVARAVDSMLSRSDWHRPLARNPPSAMTACGRRPT